MKEVTDPALLAQLNGKQEVTDPAILAQLAGETKPAAAKRWDLVGDIKGAADSAIGGMKQDFANAFPGDLMQQQQKNFNDNGLAMGAVNDLKASGGRALSALKLPFDAAGLLASPVTGALHAGLGSALSYAIPTPKEDIKVGGTTFHSDPKKAADDIVDTAMLGLGPKRGGGIAELEAAPKPGPQVTIADVVKAKNAAYKAADEAGVVIKPEAFQSFANSLATDITKNNPVQADIHKNALSALSLINDEAASGVPLSLSRADAIRQGVNGAIEKASGPNGSSSDLRIAMKIKSGLDDFLDGLTPKDTLAGDPTVAVPILKEARTLNQKAANASQIQTLIDLAENAASTGQTSADSAIRSQFKNFNAKLIRDPSEARSLSPEELAAIQQVKSSAAARALSSVGSWHIPVGSWAARAGADAVSRNNAAKALQTMLSGAQVHTP